MRRTYVNAEKILRHYNASPDNVVKEVLYVTDLDAAFSVVGRVGKEVYNSENPSVSDTILVTPRPALPTQLIEIKFIAQVLNGLPSMRGY
jgi:hypothetical protein